MCMYTRHEIFTKTMKIQLAFDNCFDINVRELDVNLKKKWSLHWNLQNSLKMNKDMNKTNKNLIKMWGICCLDNHKLKAFLKR